MKMRDYRIRAHHGMCLAFFEGKGYNSEFTAHMGEMKKLLEKKINVRIITDEETLGQILVTLFKDITILTQEVC